MGGKSTSKEINLDSGTFSTRAARYGVVLYRLLTAYSLLLLLSTVSLFLLLSSQYEKRMKDPQYAVMTQTILKRRAAAVLGSDPWAGYFIENSSNDENYRLHRAEGEEDLEGLPLSKRKLVLTSPYLTSSATITPYVPLNKVYYGRSMEVERGSEPFYYDVFTPSLVKEAEKGEKWSRKKYTTTTSTSRGEREERVGSVSNVPYVTKGYSLHEVVCDYHDMQKPRNSLEEELMQDVKNNHEKLFSLLPLDPSDYRTHYVFFLPGNAGSKSEGVYLSCALLLQYELLFQYYSHHYYSNNNSNNGSGSSNFTAPHHRMKLKVYLLEYNEQNNVHRGRLIEQQALFTIDAIHTVLKREEKEAYLDGPDRERHQQQQRFPVYLVGHSMGGITASVVSRLILFQRNDQAPPGSVGEGMKRIVIKAILSLNTPHRHPPLFFDAPMRDLYEQNHLMIRLLRYHNGWAVHPADRIPIPKIFSVTSGVYDVQIEPGSVLVNDDPPTAAVGLPQGEPRTLEQVHFFYNLQDPNVCGLSLSHVDIIRNYCSAAFGSELLFSSVLNLFDPTLYPPSSKTQDFNNNFGDRNRHPTTDSPPAPSSWPPSGRYFNNMVAIQWPQWLGLLCWEERTWSVLPAVALLYMVGEGLRPLVRFLLSPGDDTERSPLPRRRSLTRWWQLGLDLLTRNTAVLCAALFYLSLLYQLFLAAAALSDPSPSSSSLPWDLRSLLRQEREEVGGRLWFRHNTHTPLARLFRLVVASVGPFWWGVLFGRLMVKITYSTTHGLCRLQAWLWNGRLFSPLRPIVSACLRPLWRNPSTTPLLQRWRMLFPLLWRFLLFASFQYFQLLFSIRAVVWVVVGAFSTRSVLRIEDRLYLSEAEYWSAVWRHKKDDGDDDNVGGPSALKAKDTEGERDRLIQRTHRVSVAVEPMLVTMTVVFMIEIQLFFDLANHFPIESPQLIDPSYYYAERGILLLFMVERWLTDVTVPLTRLYRSKWFRGLAGLAYGLVILGAVYTLSCPLECSRVLTNLLVAFPAYGCLVVLGAAYTSRIV